MKDNKDEQENFILKKIRYYQGSIADYDTYWNQRIAEGDKSEWIKKIKKNNSDLNNDYEIKPVTKDE